MNRQYCSLINEIPKSLKKKFRSLEISMKKINNNYWSIKFNEICLNENILPKISEFIILHFNRILIKNNANF